MLGEDGGHILGAHAVPVVVDVDLRRPFDRGPLRPWERAGGLAAHMAVFCNAAPGCRSVWYRPRCERRAQAPRRLTACF
jgi:hypothetical protein